MTNALDKSYNYFSSLLPDSKNTKERGFCFMMYSKKSGSADRPIENFEKDEFQIEAYIEVLSEFIEECETPMTIAVQGDWGCGKTSMMNMVRQYLKQSDSILDVWFNTWQFSQFNMDDKLVVTFLQHLIKKLAGQFPDNSEEKKEISNKLKPIIKTIAVGMTKHFAGEDVGDIVDGVFGISEKEEEKESDLADEIFDLKKNFQELIQKVTGKTGKRVVVFVDDLDRLQPMRAVELLEVLKLFVDCDNCMFVMAIDTSVVFQGIREKYGKDMSNEKAQSFFDKMIQLPFKMPTAYYQLDKMLVRLLDFLNDTTIGEAERKKYITIIREVTDGNPRTIKRLSNAVLLMDKVAIRRKLYENEEEKVQSLTRRLLVILACVQLRYEPVYGFLVNNINYGHMKRIIDLRLPDKRDANRGKLLLMEFNNIGMPDEAVNGELVFYNLMYMFVDLSRELVHLFREKGNTEVVAVEKLMRAVSLNNIREAVNESFVADDGNQEALGCVAVTQEAGSTEVHVEAFVSAEQRAAMYSGMVLTGNALAVYNQLMEKRVYPRLSSNMKQNDGSYEQAIEDLRAKWIKPQESYLFQRINEVLLQYYEVEETYQQLTNCFVFRYRNDKAGFYFRLEYEAPERSINVYLPGKSLLTKDMKAFQWYREFIEKEQEAYRSLQKEYGTIIFPNANMRGIEVERDDEGNEQWFSGSFYLASETMADLLTEFFVRVASDEEALKTKEVKTYSSGSLLDITNGFYRE